MANFPYVRPFGIWNAGTPVLHGELTQLDQNLFKAPNFADGGAYAPSSPVYVSGAGMQILFTGSSVVPTGQSLEVDGILYCSHTFTADGNVTLSGAQTISGFTGVDGFVTFAATSTTAFALGSHVQTLGSLQVSGGLQVEGATLFTGSAFVTYNGSVSLKGGVGFAGTSSTTFSAGADLTVATDLKLSGAGTIIERVVTGANSDGSYSVSTADLVYIPANSITAARTYYLDEVGAVNGKKIRFHREDRNGAYPITLKRAVDGSTLCTLGWLTTNYIGTDVVRIAGVWQIVGGQFGSSPF